MIWFNLLKIPTTLTIDSLFLAIKHLFLNFFSPVFQTGQIKNNLVQSFHFVSWGLFFTSVLLSPPLHPHSFKATGRQCSEDCWLRYPLSVSHHRLPPLKNPCSSFPQAHSAFCCWWLLGWLICFLMAVKEPPPQWDPAYQPMAWSVHVRTPRTPVGRVN